MTAQPSLEVELIAPNNRRIKLNTGLFINNEFVASSSGNKITTIDPATESNICSVEAASADDVDKAVSAARSAFSQDSWQDLQGKDRASMLNRLADLIDANKEDLATLETWDNGKAYTTSLNVDIPAAIDTLRYYAGWADKIHGLTIPTHSKKLAYTLKQPYGVCAQIIPWNFPILMASWKIGPALATGNTVVLKPAEQTPLSMLYIAALVARAGFPPGVLNVINGYGYDTGSLLAAHQDVDKIAFTGSTATGKLIQRNASANLKNITLETGGKSPLIVFADADIIQAAKWARIASMANQGQVCTSTARFLVHESILDEFSQAFAKEVETISIGNPFEVGITQGPQVSKAQYDKILAYVSSAKQEGATLVAGGAPAKDAGYFIKPTIFKGVAPHMNVYREEIFGPFATITSFKTEREALERANDTEYGLAASIFTEDMKLAHWFASKIEAGIIWINSSLDSDIKVPFGGMKQSGIGRELGAAGLEGYLQDKSVYVNLGTKL